MVLQQKDRTTFLEFAPAIGPAVSVQLSHPGKRPEWTDGPYAARLIAEIPGKLLLFTDTLSSNPTNVQGECGASPTGERFLHAVSLTAPVRETLSVLIESCLLDLTPSPRVPVFDAAKGTLTVHFLPDHGDNLTKVYRLKADNSFVLENR
jgi:hypothetical protein